MARVCVWQTADIIMEAHPGVALETSEALRERVRGSMSGHAQVVSDDAVYIGLLLLSTSTRHQFMGDWQGQNMHARGDPPANLEPVAHLSTRAVQWWNATVARLAQRKAAELTSVGDASTFAPAHVLVVAHGGLIGTLVTTLTGSRKVRAAPGVVVGRCFNASISVVDLEEDGRGVLVSYADTTHLDVDLVQENADLLP